MQPSSSYDEDDSENDLFILTGLGRVTEYRFPLITYCPIPTCRVLFGIRSDALTHFRKRHELDKIICCVVCKTPIPTSGLELHYVQEHPHSDISINFDRKSQSSVGEPSHATSVCINVCCRCFLNV